MNITMKRTVELRGNKYHEGCTYVVNASTWRDLLKAGALKPEVKEEAPAEAAVEESAEVPKLQAKAQARKPVRRIRKTQK